ncbi:transcriptional regulator, partial [Escherichia coli]
AYQLLISCTDENPSQKTMVLNNIIPRKFDGLIVASSMLHDNDYQKLSDQFPFFLSDPHITGSTLPLVITDFFSPTAALV